jgi:uncharacterized membrane protein
MMMQQMMMQMMQQNAQGGQAPQPAASAAAAPQTPDEIQAMIDSLDLRFANGEISEDLYSKLVAKWQAKLGG